MDINTFRGILTLILVVAFIGLCIWVYSPSQKKRFEQAASLPFSDGEKANHD